MQELWTFLTHPLQVRAIWFVFFAYLCFKLGRILENKLICDHFELVRKDMYEEI